MRKFRGFTLTELLIAAMIIGTVALSITSYLVFAKKKVQQVKYGIDRYNLSQSILTEIQSWDYKGTGSKTLVYLKTYLEENNYDYLKYLKKLAEIGDETGKIFNIQAMGGGLYILDNVGNSFYKVRVILEFAQEDIIDSDGDGITTELVFSNSDNNIMRITVQTALYDEKTLKEKGEAGLLWATAIGYKGISMQSPSIDFVINDLSDDDLTPGPNAVLLGLDIRKTADMNNGLNHLKNMFEFDLDTIDQNGDGKKNYNDGGFWEADSDGVDNDGDGIIDNALEQAYADGTPKKLRALYDIEVYSSEPFTLSAAGGTYGVFITDKVGINPPYVSTTDWHDITSWFEEVSGSDKKHYKTKSSMTLKVSNMGTVNQFKLDNPVEDLIFEGTYTVCVIGRTNPTLASGYTMIKSYPVIVDTTPPVVSDISPSDGSFIPTTTVTLAARAYDPNNASKLNMAYVLERMPATGLSGYTWVLRQIQTIENNVDAVSALPSSLNISVNIPNVSFGWHYYRIVVLDRAGNAGYQETSVYVSPTTGDKGGNKTGDGKTGTGLVGGLRIPGIESPEAANFPIIQPLAPWSAEQEILATGNDLISTFGTVANMPIINSSTPKISILLIDSDVSDGIETQSGIVVDRQSGWPKVFYKVYEKDDVVDSSIWSAEGVSDATALSNHIQYNVNNVIVQFVPESIPVNGKVLIGVKAIDKSGNLSVREWVVKTDDSYTNPAPEISNILLFQRANHPNWIAPFPYNPDWLSTNNDVENKNFFIGFSTAGRVQLKTVTLHYTDVFDPASIPSSVEYHRQTLDLTDKYSYGDNFGFNLSDLNLSSPGVFMYFITVEDVNGKIAYFYNKSITMPYYRDTLESPIVTNKIVTMPITQFTPPASSSFSATSLNHGAISAAIGKWVMVPVQKVRILTLNMDTSTNADAIEEVYKDPAGAFYWNSSSSDFKMIKVEQNISYESLKGLIDKNSNDIFDDYDIIVMFTGDTAAPPGFDEGVIVHLHRWLMSPTENDVYRNLDNDVFYPWDGVGRGVSPHYSASVAPRVVFIGKRFFNVTRNSSSPWTLWEAFAARWAGIDPSSRQAYDVAVNPYVVSNLRFAYDVGTGNKIDDTLFGRFLGQVIPVWKTDGSLDVDATDAKRDELDKYQIKLAIAQKSPVVNYDGIDTNSIDGPYRWKLMGENFPKEKVQPATSSGLTVPVDITTDLPINPSVHNGTVASPYDYYKYAARWSLVFGDGLEDLGYTAGTWVYKGRVINGKWDYRIFDNERDTINSKVLYLGFGIESVATKDHRYVMMKRIIRFMYY